MRKVTVAAVQMACVPDAAENRRTAETMVRRAAADGAQIILLPELFENPYFCQERRYASYDLATTPAENPAIQQLRRVAAELNVVLPVSFYEKAGNVLYNSVAIIDADGTVLGIYRKTHIPDDHFYQEKFYFTPGDTGFKVWNTRYAKIGVGICWDQWFPEAARCMALAGAELLFYPTAIGSEPILEVDSAPHWQRCMQGHAAANLMPVIAANRIGTETITPDEENQQQPSGRSPPRNLRLGRRNRGETARKLPLFSYPAEPPSRASLAPRRARLRQESASTQSKHLPHRLPGQTQPGPLRQSSKRHRHDQESCTKQTNRRTP